MNENTHLSSEPMLYPPPKRETGAQDTPATGGNEWLFYVIWGVVLAVTTLVVALFMEGVEGARNSVPTLLGVFGFGVLLLVCFWFNVVLHEAGHWTAGSMGGRRVYIIAVGPLWFKRTPWGWRLRWYKRIQEIGGLAFMLPKVGRQPSKAEDVMYSLGGPLANFVLALVCWGLLSSGADGLWRMVLYTVMVQSLIIGVMNLLPFHVGAWRTDGQAVLDAYFAPLSSLGQQITQLTALEFEGVSTRNWPQDLVPTEAQFQAAEHVTVAHLIQIFRLTHAIVCRDDVQAQQCAYWFAQHYDTPELDATLQSQTALMMAIYALVMCKDVALCKAWRSHWSQDQVQVFDGSAQAYIHWLDAELALAAGNIGQAKQACVKAYGALQDCMAKSDVMQLQAYLISVVQRIDALEKDMSGGFKQAV
jgi:hypothetical protein